MGELDYSGFLAMLWIVFVLITIYFVVTDKAVQRASAEVSFWRWLFGFWRFPVGVIDLVFGRKLPEWLGPVIWLAPAYLLLVVEYSEIYKFGEGWGFSIGRLAIIWFS
jgi:hypothetical protein